jgi:hypothetical protein
MLRLGENAIYRLRSLPLVARIARTVDYLPAIETEVAAARWLESVAFPAVRLAGPADQPFVADGRVVTTCLQRSWTRRPDLAFRR